jgi:hypothetical protein
MYTPGVLFSLSALLAAWAVRAFLAAKIASSMFCQFFGTPVLS